MSESFVKLALLKCPSLMKAVFLKILHGVPFNLSFLTIDEDLSSSRTTPVAAIRKSDYREKSKSTLQNISENGP